MERFYKQKNREEVTATGYLPQPQKATGINLWDEWVCFLEAGFRPTEFRILEGPRLSSRGAPHYDVCFCKNL